MQQPQPPPPPQLFKAQAEAYAAYRPSGPEQVWEIILAALPDETSQRRLAVDVATGSGQAARQAAAHFARVVATDACEQQLRHAGGGGGGGEGQHANVEFALGDAHAITQVADGAADLVTAASALHWLRPAEFYAEARRVLHPEHGLLACWAIPLGVAAFEVPSAPAAAPAVSAAMYDLYEKELGPYWDERKRLCDTLWSELRMPTLQDFRRVELRELVMPLALTPARLAAYCSTWSAHARHRAARPGEPDPLVAFRAAVEAALLAAGAAADAEVRALVPVVLLLAQGPKPLAARKPAASATAGAAAAHGS